MADKAKEDYKLALDSFNKTQTLYYQADLPDTINVSAKTCCLFSRLCFALYIFTCNRGVPIKYLMRGYAPSFRFFLS